MTLLLHIEKQRQRKILKDFLCSMLMYSGAWFLCRNEIDITGLLISDPLRTTTCIRIRNIFNAYDHLA